MSSESQYLFWILIHDFEPPHCTTCIMYCTLCNLQHSKLRQFLLATCCEHVHAHAETYSLSCWSGTFVSWRFAPLGLVSEQPFIKMSLDLSSAANQQAERLQEGSWGRGAGRLLTHTHSGIVPGDVTVVSGQREAAWSQTPTHLFFFSYFRLILQHCEVRNAATLQRCNAALTAVSWVKTPWMCLETKGTKGLFLEGNASLGLFGLILVTSRVSIGSAVWVANRLCVKSCSLLQSHF